MKISDFGQLFNQRKGSALLVSLGLIVTMGILSISLLQSSLSESRMTEREAARLIAFQLAEGAVDQTIVSLRADRAFMGIPRTPVNTGGNQGAYETTVTSLGTDNQGNALYSIQSRGIFGANTASSNYAERQVNATIQFKNQSPFKWAAYALYNPNNRNDDPDDSNIDITGGSKVDSVDTTKGFFMDCALGQEGDIATNASHDDVIKLSGGSDVKGTAWLPDPNQLKQTGNSTLSDGAEILNQAPPLPSNILTSPPAGISDSGDLKYSGNAGGRWNRVSAADGSVFKCTDPQFYGGDPFSAGSKNYWFDKISISSGNHVVIATTPAVLYVTGDVKLTGGAQLNPAGCKRGGQPTAMDLLIYVIGNNKVEISGGGWLLGAIYAPDSEIKITGGSRVVGAVIGESVQISGGSRLDYDLAVQNMSVNGFSAAQMTGWQDFNSSMAQNALSNWDSYGGGGSSGGGDYGSGDYGGGNYGGGGYGSGDYGSGYPGGYYGPPTLEPTPDPSYYGGYYGPPAPEPAPDPSYYGGYYGPPTPDLTPEPGDYGDYGTGTNDQTATNDWLLLENMYFQQPPADSNTGTFESPEAETQEPASSDTSS